MTGPSPLPRSSVMLCTPGKEGPGKVREGGRVTNTQASSVVPYTPGAVANYGRSAGQDACRPRSVLQGGGRTATPRTPMHVMVLGRGELLLHPGWPRRMGRGARNVRPCGCAYVGGSPYCCLSAHTAAPRGKARPSTLGAACRILLASPPPAETPVRPHGPCITARNGTPSNSTSPSPSPGPGPAPAPPPPPPTHTHQSTLPPPPPTAAHKKPGAAGDVITIIAIIAAIIMT